MNKDIAILIMAAGASTRMEPVKQLLAWKGNTMLEHVYQRCRASRAGQTFIVLGAYAEKIKGNCTAPSADIFINPNWRKGLGNSIAFGVNSVLGVQPGLKGILIVLGDQPRVSANHLDKLISLWEKRGVAVAATRYREKTGVPALFDRKLFDEIRVLDGPRGAQPLLSSTLKDIETIDGRDYIADIDTLEDYERLKKEQG